MIQFAMVAMAASVAALQTELGSAKEIDPATPSAQIPLYRKPSTPKRKGKPGAKPGHPGVRRAPPAQIDRHEEHRLACSPDCGGPLQRCQRSRQRVIVDVPVALTSWLHCGPGVTIDQIVAVMGQHLRTRLSAGGLLAMWQRLAAILTTWYEQIAQQARQSAVLNADETGWRINGHTCWLWCFCSQQTCYYLIDHRRGSPALQKFFAEASAKLLRRLLRDGIRLRKRPDFALEAFRSGVRRLDARLIALARGQYQDADARRLAQRLSKYRPDPSAQIQAIEQDLQEHQAAG